jgi:hypothetical protein
LITDEPPPEVVEEVVTVEIEQVPDKENLTIDDGFLNNMDGLESLLGDDTDEEQNDDHEDDSVDPGDLPFAVIL